MKRRPSAIKRKDLDRFRKRRTDGGGRDLNGFNGRGVRGLNIKGGAAVPWGSGVCNI